MNCEYCGSLNLKNLGVRFLGKERKIKYKCNNCGSEQYADCTVNKPIYGTNFVVTSATDGFPINKRFLEVLKNYCALNSARLIILPVNNKQQYNEFNYDPDIREYLVSDNIQVADDTVIVGSIHLGTTLESPLHGMQSFSKGKSVIFGHPQIQLKTLPRKTSKYPPIMCTTGSISIPKYTENKTAQKANFNHSFSAVFVSGGSVRHIRHLNYDSVGFYDIDKYYMENSVRDVTHIDAIVTGDEHVMFQDKSVFNATYGAGGIVDTLKPAAIVRHDVLDCFSISHHHKNNVFVRYGKREAEIDSIERELNQTIKFIEDTTPDYAKSWVVPSNHNSHLMKWLNDADPKLDLTNAKLYHKLMYMMLDNVTVSENNIPVYPDPFELYSRDRVSGKVVFLKADQQYMLHGIDLNNHGDRGINGSRGSIGSFKDLPHKTVIGHSHSPGIEKGVYQTGTSTLLRLEYNSGLSSWHHAHCLIYPNGKRQLIFIYDGVWR